MNNILEKNYENLYFENVHRNKFNDILYNIIYLCKCAAMRVFIKKIYFYLSSRIDFMTIGCGHIVHV